MNLELQTRYRTADARQQFDHWSGTYDWNPLQPLFFGPSHRMLLEALNADDRQILDIGCGTGLFAARVRERFPGTQVCGLDLSAGMLRQAGARRGMSESGSGWIQADSERLPFASNTFDAITCSHSFHHYPHAERVVKEMHRVLRPGGRLLIIDGDRDRLWGRLIFDVFIVWIEGPVRHLSGEAFQTLYRSTGFNPIAQRRRGGLLPFLMTVGQAVKPARTKRRQLQLIEESLILGH